MSGSQEPPPTTSGALADMDPDSPLAEELRELVAASDHIKKENELLLSYLAKIDPNNITLPAEDTEAAKKKKKKSKAAAGEADKRDGGGGAALFKPLADEEKSEIVTQEIEVLQAGIANAKKLGDKDLDDIKTLMEEVEIRISETKRDTLDFKRDIILGAEDPKTGKTQADKVTKFLEDRIKSKEAMVDKLTMKNAVIKAQIVKLEQQLAHKEEMGEVLNLVDFDQLKIENQQYMERIEEKNNELLQLKLSTSRTVQVLNSLKQQLHELSASGGALRGQIRDLEDNMSKLEAAGEEAEAQAGKVAKTVARLKYEAEDMDQPSILDYIKVKQEGVDLEKAIVDIKRKTEILQMEYQQKRAMLGQLNASYGLTPMSPGPGGANMFSARTTAMTPRGTVDGLGKGGPLTPTRQ